MTSATQYLTEIASALARGDATEHTHRPSLKALVESIAPGILATNEPKHVACGAPDFVISRAQNTLGYIEAKDVGKRLADTEKSDQFKRYLKGLSNLILTDYLEFRWYVDGQRRKVIRIAEITGAGVVGTSAAEADLQELFGLFFEQKARPTGAPRELASRMADLAKIAKQVIIAALRNEDRAKSGVLHQQLDGFRRALLHDMTDEQFADMYAQTVAYGLFTAKCNTLAGGRLDRKGAAWLLPRTNPFLRSIFNNIAGPDADDDLEWIIDAIADLLDQSDVGAILGDFGKRTRQLDPVLHFYETFLREYDPKMREARGVYYTPEPVVGYIVRSVDQLLRRDFGCQHGLADESKVAVSVRQPDTTDVVERSVHRVQVLDPATGTGTFLYEVISKIYERFRTNKGAWSGYVTDHLLPRIFGFELLMAPYAVAHLKLGLLLKDTGYDIDKDERIGVYMTNTLEESSKIGASLFAQAVADEANAAYGVKKDAPVMVIIGNPPYSRDSLNQGAWITDLLAEYKRDIHEKKLNWDDFTKFIRFGQWRIEQTGYGILAFITNNTYIDAVTLRRMRESLMGSFDDIYILDLHGDSLRKELAPGGATDENVFDIRQGVCIGIFVRRATQQRGLARVHHAELWGSRQGKYDALSASDVTTTDWTQVDDIAGESCLGKQYLLKPLDKTHLKEYCDYHSVSSIFKVGGNGIKTDRDSLFFGLDKDEVLQRIRILYSPDGVDEPFRTKYKVVKSSSYDLPARRVSTRFDPANVHRCLYRPYDAKWLYYAVGITSRPAYDVMRHMMAGSNLALITTRQTADAWDALATDILCGHKSCAAYDINSVFPLYVYSNGQSAAQQWLDMEAGPGGRHPNLSPSFIEHMSSCLHMGFVTDGSGNLETTFGPREVFHYIYCVLHSATYRARYAEFLRIDYARVPVTSTGELFRSLCTLGSKLVALHLMTSTGADPANFPIALPKSDPARDIVEFVRYSEPHGSESGKVRVNSAQYFDGIEPDVWNCRVGGYQVCRQWLEDRKGRRLTFDDIEHYSNIVSAIRATTRLSAQIDEEINAHGGWPIR